MNPPNKKTVPGTPLEWLAHAGSDLALARLGRTDSAVLSQQVCFHAQQSVEKAMKAVLLFHHLDFPFTHDLEELIRIFEKAHGSLPHDLQGVGVLTPYAVEIRYPGYWGVVDEKEVEEAIDLSEKIMRWAGDIIR